MSEENPPPRPGGNSGVQIKAFAERLIRLQDEQKAIGEDISDLKREAKGVGLEPKEIVSMAKLIRKGKEQAHVERDMLDVYLQALGWLD